MNNSRSIRVHYLFRSVLLLALALYIAQLAEHNALLYYVTPKLARWVKLCPVLLVPMALSLALQAVSGRSSALCDCEQRLPRSVWRSAALYALFLIPLLLGYLLPDRTLLSTAAASKGLTLLPADEQLLAGREVTFTGFLYPHEPRDADNTFTAARFLVHCCTADAAPLGILVDPGQQKSLPADTWIEVRGKLQIVQYEGREMLQISAAKILPIPEPAVPYLYTEPDSAASLEQLLQP
ncbi:TIGR03943 family putative permease subunit [Paenibacillus donghaensis]|nr:TIGR03943 family protein [Paenibacillus donghaensis]